MFREFTRPNQVVHATTVHRSQDNRIFYKECTTSATAGFDVTLIAPNDANREENGVRVIRIDSYESRVARILFGTFAVLRRAIVMRPAIFHIHDPELLPVAWIMSFLGTLVIFDMHENVAETITTKEWIPRGLRLLVKQIYLGLQNFLLRRFYVVFAEISYAKHMGKNRGTVTILNFPHFKTMDVKTSRKDGDILTLVYLGTVTRTRGSIIYLEALQILQREGLPIALQIVGPATKEHRRELEEYVRANELRDVTISGFLSPGRAFEEMQKCHVGLAVLAPLANYVESYPTKIFEYMIAGLPVVSSNFPLYQRVVADTGVGLCVTPDDAPALADAVRWLYARPLEREKMGLRGQTVVKDDYNWESQGEKLVAFYRKLLGGVRGRA